MLKVYYCDILHRPEEEFYRATMREITQRLNAYCEIKGYKPKAQEVQEYDDEV